MTTREPLTLENVYLCEGVQIVSIMTTKINEKLVKKLANKGLKYISTRTIGFDHIDLKVCETYGVHAGNVSYSLSSVAEYTIMMILMSLLNMKLILDSFMTQDFSLDHIRGKELKDLTVRVIGTGKIGQYVIRLLSGFSCRILAYDLYSNEEMKKYVDLDTLYRESDVITLHAPASEETYHMINKNSLNKMKNGVIIVNTTRGRLINTNDFIDAIENLKVGYAALDVVENEHHLYYKDLKNQVLDNREIIL